MEIGSLGSGWNSIMSVWVIRHWEDAGITLVGFFWGTGEGWGGSSGDGVVGEWMGCAYVCPG